MTEKELFRIIGDIDDRYVEEAAPENVNRDNAYNEADRNEVVSFEEGSGGGKHTPRRRRKKQGRKVYWYGFASGVAAMLVLTIGLSVAQLQIKNTQMAEKAQIPETTQNQVQLPETTQSQAKIPETTQNQMQIPETTQKPDENVANEKPGVVVQEEAIEASKTDDAEDAQAMQADDAGGDQAFQADDEEDAQAMQADDAGSDQAFQADDEEDEQVVQAGAAEEMQVPQLQFQALEQAALFKDGSPAPENGYILPDSLERVLTGEDIENLTLKGIEYAQNEIWARYGRAFDTEELKNYFLSQDWYNPRYQADGSEDQTILSQMSEAARENVEFLARAQAEQEESR